MDLLLAGETSALRTTSDFEQMNLNADDLDNASSIQSACTRSRSRRSSPGCRRNNGGDGFRELVNPSHDCGASGDDGGAQALVFRPDADAAGTPPRQRARRWAPVA